MFLKICCCFPLLLRWIKDPVFFFFFHPFKLKFLKFSWTSRDFHGLLETSMDFSRLPWTSDFQLPVTVKLFRKKEMHFLHWGGGVLVANNYCSPAAVGPSGVSVTLKGLIPTYASYPVDCRISIVLGAESMIYDSPIKRFK